MVDRPMSRVRRPLIALAALLAPSRALGDPPPPQAPPAASAPAPPLEAADREKQAVAYHDEAKELYAHGQYRAAISKLEAAIALDPEGKELYYNLALIHERLAEFDAAERDYRRYLEKETSPHEREKVQAILRRLEGAKREVLPPAPSAQPSAAPAAPPPPKPAPPAPRATSPWVYVSGAVGASGLFAGVVLGISAVARAPGAGAMTRLGVSADDLMNDARTAHHEAVAADLSFLIGAAAAGAAIYLYYAARGEPPKHHAAAGLQAAPRLGIAF
jgi:tetratricopeptide (TPR) repeat protein